MKPGQGGMTVKTLAAMIVMVLALGFVCAAEAQSPMPKAPPGANQPPVVGRPPGHVRPPAPSRPPSFMQSPFFFRRPFFWPGFVGGGDTFASAESALPQTYVYSYAYPVYVQAPAYDQLQAQYWAYCRSPQGYYPYVSDCPTGWLPVTPTVPPPPLLPGPTALDAGRQPKDPPPGGDTVEEIRLKISRSRAD